MSKYVVKEIVKRGKEIECSKCNNKIFLATFIDANTDQMPTKKDDPSKLQWLPFDALTKELHDCPARKTPETIKLQDQLIDGNIETEEKKEIQNVNLQELIMKFSTPETDRAKGIAKNVIVRYTNLKRLCLDVGIKEPAVIGMLFNNTEALYRDTIDYE